MTEILPAPVRNWACPSCNVKDRTMRYDVHTQMHPCAGLGGIVVPLVEVKHFDDRPDARHIILEREDYAGSPLIPRFMGVRTEHGSGRVDATITPPTATIDVKAHR